MALMAFMKVKGRSMRLYRTRKYLGKIDAVYFDKQLHCIYCTAVKVPFIWRKAPISVSRIVFTSKEMQVKEEKNSLDVDKVDSFNLLSMSVYTETGSYLGKVYDFIFDTNTLALLQIDIQQRIFFSKTKEFLIHRSEIIRMEKKRIIVKDDVIGLEEENPDLFSPRIEWPMLPTKNLKNISHIEK